MTDFDRYIAAAEGRRGLWRLIPGLVIIAVCWLAWTALVLSSVVLLDILAGADVRTARMDLQALMESGSPGAAALMLATFIGIWPGVWLALRLLHGRRFGTVLSPERSYRWGEFRLGLTVGLTVYLLSLAVAIVIGGAPTRTELGLTTWLLFLAPIGGLVFLQASGEELIFRGYLGQELAKVARSPLVWAALPALFFGVLHYLNAPTPIQGLLYILATFLFGIAAALLLWQTGALPAAMGLHTGLNLCSLSIAGLDGPLSGARLYSLPAGQEISLFVINITGTVCLLAVLASPLSPFRRRPRETPAE